MELFDEVDSNDKVIGTTDKATAHAQKQLHRVVAVYVFNDKGEVYVQVHKKSGGLYDHSVGGHVSKGETYTEAATREAKEELGITQPLTYLSTFHSDELSIDHIFGLFECSVPPGWQFVPTEEVDTIIPMKLENVRDMMQRTPEKFTNGFINTMKEYYKVKGLS